MTGPRFQVRVVSTLAVLGMLFAPIHAAAQVAVGTLVGSVRDDSGGGVPGVTVTATETRTNIVRTAVSNATGNYSFNNLAPGVYRVDGELVGFKKFSREGVEVSVNTTVRVEIVLAVGQLEESVMVTGEAPMLQTDRTDTGRIIESTQITQMPLGFNRNFQALLITVPGASRPFRPHSEFYNSQDSLSSNVNGQSRQVNNVQLEGADNSDNGGSLAFYIPSAEAIESVVGCDEQLRRGVRPRRRRGHERDDQVGNEHVRRIGLRLRQHRGDDGAQSVYDARAGRLQVPAGGLHVRRTAQARQAVLLRRFRPHHRRQRPPHTGARAGGRVPQRRLQRGADAHLRSGDRQCRRQRPDAVREQSDSGRTASARSRGA